MTIRWPHGDPGICFSPDERGFPGSSSRRRRHREDDLPPRRSFGIHKKRPNIAKYRDQLPGWNELLPVAILIGVGMLCVLLQWSALRVLKEIDTQQCVAAIEAVGRADITCRSLAEQAIAGIKARDGK